MSEPVTTEQIAALLHRELKPIRDEVGHVRDAIEGKEGLQVDVAVLATRLKAVEDALRGGPPANRSSSPESSDQGGLTVKLSGKGWQRIIRWLLAVLLPAGVVSGGTYWAIGDGPTPPPTEAPRAVTVPAPSVPQGTQELP